MSDYITPDLISNILGRLPVDDVLRCTSVCKSWYELITSPSFTILHLNLCSSNQEPRLLVRDFKQEDPGSPYRYRLYRDNQNFDRIADIEPTCYEVGSSWRVIDCINGLFCLYDYHNDTIMLWNPSLRKSIILPESRFCCKTMFLGTATVGFGFVAASNQYKILKFSSSKKGGHRAEIYELGTGSWRILECDGFSGVKVGRQQAHLNGIIHWCPRSHYGNANIPICIWSFDMKKEKFGALMAPSCLRHGFHYAIPSIFKVSLCLIDVSDEKFCTVWLMKEYGDGDSWEKVEKLFFIAGDEHVPTNGIAFRHNEELFFVKPRGYDSAIKDLVSYDCYYNQVKNLGISVIDPSYGYSFTINTYVDSLVLIKDPNKVQNDEDSGDF